MAYKISTKSFTITAQTDKEALTTLLKLLGQDIASFSSYMGVTEQEVVITDDDGNETVAIWAINYLKDILEVELIHLGYVTKDLKAQGIFGGYNDTEFSIKQARDAGAITESQPLVINTDTIITEAGTIKIKYLANAEAILQDFLSQ
ncbi:MAG: hypothetical protein QM497_07805 [Sulfurimonas sp.]